MMTRWQRIRQWWRQLWCRHDFKLSDLEQTKIPEPVLARDASFDDAMKFEAVRWQHPSHTERVAWPCYRCGKEFRAHCGLDILSRYRR